MLDHYKGGTKRGQVWNFDQNSDCFKWFWSNILLPFQVNQTFLNIGNITYTQTTSTKIQIGPSSRWVEIGFVGIHATHGSHTMPGKFLGNFQNLRSQQNSLKVLSWCGFLEMHKTGCEERIICEVFYWLPARCFMEPATEARNKSWMIEFRTNLVGTSFPLNVSQEILTMLATCMNGAAQAHWISFIYYHGNLGAPPPMPPPAQVLKHWVVALRFSWYWLMLYFLVPSNSESQSDSQVFEAPANLEKFLQRVWDVMSWWLEADSFCVKKFGWRIFRFVRFVRLA